MIPVATDRMCMRFWGVRGSIPTPCPENLTYGGNTACLEVRLPSGDICILDGGTGAHPLGAALTREMQGSPISLNFFLTHFHWDHIQGIPFFSPLYGQDNHIVFYAHPKIEEIRETLEGQMTNPYFPVDFQFLRAQRKFVSTEGREFVFGETTLQTFALNHPQRAFGYRLQHGSHSLVLASDLEHGDPAFDDVLREAVHGADVLIYDAQYTPEEYDMRRGWGHSTWLQATRVANECGVGKLLLTHHDPSHNDDALDAILVQAKREFANTEMAVEGSIHEIG
jgi:phosphoribosyl 1,2-cyclic phosphodiesterase